MRLAFVFSITILLSLASLDAQHNDANHRLNELWSMQLPEGRVPQFSLSKDGNLCVVSPRRSTDRVRALQVFNNKGEHVKTWTAPSGSSFTRCLISDSYVVASYSSDRIALFSALAEDHLWSRSLQELYDPAIVFSPDGGRIGLPSRPLDIDMEPSSIYMLDMNGDLLWTVTLESAVNFMDISANNYLAVAGEKFGVITDPQGVHAVYLLDPTGEILWHIETESPVIDVAISDDGQFVVAGTNSGHSLFISRDGQVLWEKEAIGGWVDIDSEGSLVIAKTGFDDLALLDQSGKLLWRNDEVSILGGEDLIVISQNGAYIAASGVSAGAKSNVALLSQQGELLYQDHDSEREPKVGIVDDYAAIYANDTLRVFKLDLPPNLAACRLSISLQSLQLVQNESSGNDWIFKVQVNENPEIEVSVEELPALIMSQNVPQMEGTLGVKAIVVENDLLFDDVGEDTRTIDYDCSDLPAQGKVLGWEQDVEVSEDEGVFAGATDIWRFTFEMELTPPR